MQSRARSSYAEPQPAVAVSISIATAKVVNIFHTTKYFDKNFQNIFNYFFSLPREKVFPAQRATFSDFMTVRWYAGTLGHFDKRGDKDWVINGLIEYIYFLKYIFKVYNNYTFLCTTPTTFFLKSSK